MSIKSKNNPNQPDAIGKYRIVRQLGTGGMAEVFLGSVSGPMGFEKSVVIKRILPHLAGDQEFIDLFLSEARLAAQLAHSNLVQIFDFGEDNGSYFIAMEYVDGPDLQGLINVRRTIGAPLGPEVCAKIISCASEGLGYVHELRDSTTGSPLNLVHRDISPNNILLSTSGTVKVFDFGIAKPAGVSRTQAGVARGKIAYMPPEQLQGKVLDGRADLFALGMVLFELLTLRKPFAASTDVSIMQAILYEPFLSLNSSRPDVPKQLSTIVDRCLAKDRDRRYPNCRELRQDLEKYLGESGKQVGTYEIGLVVEAYSLSKAKTNPDPSTSASEERTPVTSRPSSLLNVRLVTHESRQSVTRGQQGLGVEPELEASDANARLSFALVGGIPVVSCKGSLSSENPTELLNPFFGKVHDRLLQLQVKQVRVDLRSLAFMNSSAFKGFVYWLSRISAVPEPLRYRLQFDLNLAKRWQLTSISTLRCFAVSLVDVDGQKGA